MFKHLNYIFGLILTCVLSYGAQAKAQTTCVDVLSRTPLLWSNILNQKVTFFGETHSDSGARKFLINNLAELKKNGITHLALESLPIDLQREAHKYFETGSEHSLSFLRKSLTTVWQHDPQSYIDLIVYAKSLGVKIIAIDMPYSLQNLLPTESKIFMRDEYMAKVLTAKIKSVPEAKIVVLIGAIHSSRNRQPRHLFKASGIESKSFLLQSPGIGTAQFGKSPILTLEKADENGHHGIIILPN